MAAKKKSATRKSTAERLEDSIVGRPIVIANKAYLAGLGLAANVRSELPSAFSKLAKDGEKVRNEYRSSLNEMRNDIVDQVKSAQKRIEKNVKSVAKSVADYSPVATQSDIQKLNSKMDKVLAEVAK